MYTYFEFLSKFVKLFEHIEKNFAYYHMRMFLTDVKYYLTDVRYYKYYAYVTDIM